ncbi:MAG: DegV family protein [Clostridia bacterium]|nr:DegV family protein [Clostridia bacterium]
MPVAIVTDTNSGISAQEGKELGVSVIPMPVIVNGECYFEEENITHADLYAAMRAKKEVSTSMPSPQSFCEVWDKLLKEGYDGIVHLPMSSGLSASCEMAKQFAENYGGKVQVVDNHRISFSMRIAVFDAIKLAKRGKTAEEIKRILEDHAYNASIYITVNSLEYLKKSGRVTAAAAAIATVLNIKPVLTIQGGKLDAFKKVHGIKKSKEVMLEALSNELKTRFAHVPKERLIIGTAGTLETQAEVDEVIAAAKKTFPGLPVYYTPLSCSIACHTGIGAVGFGICVEEE